MGQPINRLYVLQFVAISIFMKMKNKKLYPPYNLLVFGRKMLSYYYSS